MLFQQELFEAIADLAVAAIASHGCAAGMAVGRCHTGGRRGRQSGCNALC